MIAWAVAIVMTMACATTGPATPTPFPAGSISPAEWPTPATTIASGKALFDANCAACHGPNGSGSAIGPPLVHVIYEPNHHPDQSFQNAVQNGVRAHHWNFGDMAPLPLVTAQQVEQITCYIRSAQHQSGIAPEPRC